MPEQTPIAEQHPRTEPSSRAASQKKIRFQKRIPEQHPRTESQSSAAFQTSIPEQKPIPELSQMAAGIQHTTKAIISAQTGIPGKHPIQASSMESRQAPQPHIQP